MDRLTERSHWPDGHWMVALVRCVDESGNLLQDGQYVPQAVIDRLAAYEDTGLTPEEIKRSDRMLRDFITFSRDHGRTLDWMLEKVEAENEGRLIVLPCKVGDTVYYIDGGKSYKAKAVTFRFNESGVRVYCERNYMGYIGFEGIYGKNVFLTRDEAETALGRADP